MITVLISGTVILMCDSLNSSASLGSHFSWILKMRFGWEAGKCPSQASCQSLGPFIHSFTHLVCLALETQR